MKQKNGGNMEDCLELSEWQRSGCPIATARLIKLQAGQAKRHPACQD